MSEMHLQKLAAALLIPIWAAAQTPLPQLRIEPTTGGSIFFIHNSSSQPLTAFLIELLNYPGSYYALWQDDVTSEPVPAGGDLRIQVANMTVGAVPDYVTMQAALYADGTSSGNPEKISQLTERRRFTLETMRTLIQRLEKAQSAGTSKAEVQADLKRWAESMQPAGKPKRNSQTAINQAGARSLIESTIAMLGAHSVEEILASLRASEHRATLTKAGS